MDLSKLLGDLYQTDEVEAPVDAPPSATVPAAPPSSVPDPAPAAADNPPDPGPPWADEALLDEAFASWTPGPPDDAPALEREMANGFPATYFPELEGELSSDGGVGEPMAGEHQSSVEEGSAPGPVPNDGQDDVFTGEAIEAGPPRMWSRADDDVLPRRRQGGRRGLRLSLRRR